MPKQIKIDEAYLRGVVQKLKGIRNQVTTVRAGANPNDMAHPHGGHLNSLVVRTGSDNFAAGKDLRERIRTVGGQVDQRLAAYDQKLSSYGQNLERIIASSDDIEDANTSYASSTGLGNGPTGSGNTGNNT
ncbi:hypothetical protein [Micromonospora sp. NPDC005367]|uniref:hypothetical protein n=1 Tax=Micromonospora sp. NPDC005367 TaxID=3155590 RepID=UPI0033AB7FB6